jgi:hypothetical protein
MKRLIRQRWLTPAEADKYNLVRRQIAAELPDLIARHQTRVMAKFKPYVGKFGITHEWHFRRMTVFFGQWVGFSKPFCGKSFCDVDAINLGFFRAIWPCKHRR